MPYVAAAERTRQVVAAARTVMARDGVATTNLRGVAAEAGIPLGTLQYVFPTKEQLLEAVVVDVVDEISALLTEHLPTEGGLEHAVRAGMTAFWETLVVDQVPLQLMQAELLSYSLRRPDQEAGASGPARRQYERYLEALTSWGERAADAAGETTTMPLDQLARVLLAGVDGLILQYVSDPDDARARADLEVLVSMALAQAGIRRV